MSIAMIAAVIVIAISFLIFLGAPQVNAESDSALIKVQVSPTTYKISANPTREYTELEKINAVNGLERFTIGRVTKSDEESLAYYARIESCDYLQVRPSFYCEIEGIGEDIVLNRDEYFLAPKTRSFNYESPNGYMASVTNIWISDYNNAMKKIEIETGYFWLKKPSIWNRNAYVIYNWGTKPNYYPDTENPASGELISMHHSGNNYYETVESAIKNVGVDSSHMTFAAKLKSRSGTWDITVFNTNFTLISKETFNFTVAYYHDQGVIPYNSFLSKLSVSAGVVSVQLQDVFSEVKEYRAGEPFLVEV